MDINDNIEIFDLGLLLVKEKVLVIGDLHMGIEEELTEKGILIPKFHFKDIMKRLENILNDLEVNKIIVNGDLKHEFSKMSDDEWRNSLKLIDFLKSKGELMFIKGNHDNFIQSIAVKGDIRVLKKIKIDNVLILHGDFIPEKIDADIIIIGHEHPAISLREGVKIERYKCFLKGKWKNKTLIVMPSFNLLREGTDVLNRNMLSPFLKGDLSNFEVYIVDEEKNVYKFGKLKDL